MVFKHMGCLRLSWLRLRLRKPPGNLNFTNRMITPFALKNYSKKDMITISTERRGERVKRNVPYHKLFRIKQTRHTYIRFTQCTASNFKNLMDRQTNYNIRF